MPKHTPRTRSELRAAFATRLRTTPARPAPRIPTQAEADAIAAEIARLASTAAA